MKPLSSPLRGALIGCGFFAQNHLHAWQQLEGVDIVAVCDADPQRLQQTSQRFGIPRTLCECRGDARARNRWTSWTSPPR